MGKNYLHYYQLDVNDSRARVGGKSSGEGPCICMFAWTASGWSGLSRLGITCRGCALHTCAQSGSGLNQAKDLRPVFTCR